MATVTIHNGTKLIEVEVTEEFAAKYYEMEHEEALIERKETRRHQSLDRSLDSGHDFTDESVSIEDTAIRNEEMKQLHIAVAKLTSKQRWLIRQVFFCGRTLAGIAHTLKISKAATTQQLQVIYRRLRELLTYPNMLPNIQPQHSSKNNSMF